MQAFVSLRPPQSTTTTPDEDVDWKSRVSTRYVLVPGNQGINSTFLPHDPLPRYPPTLKSTARKKTKATLQSMSGMLRTKAPHTLPPEMLRAMLLS